MTIRKDSPVQRKAERLEDELIQSILDAPAHEIREFLAASGDDPDRAAADVQATIQKAIDACGQEQLRRAKAEFSAWKTQQSGTLFSPSGPRSSILTQVRSSSANIPMLLAARKGKELTAVDEEGLEEDLEEAERLERDAEKE
jgi:hypothetical protein